MLLPIWQSLVTREELRFIIARYWLFFVELGRMSTPFARETNVRVCFCPTYVEDQCRGKQDLFSGPPIPRISNGVPDCPGLIIEHETFENQASATVFQLSSWNEPRRLPGGLVSEHGVENDSQLAHASG